MYQVISIASDVVETMKATKASPGYGHPVSVEVARGHGPCRHCLQPFSVGQEARMLFTYDSFRGMDAVPQPGPVFVHEEACRGYARDGGYPRGLLPFSVVMDGHGADHMVKVRERVSSGSQHKALCAMLADPLVQYVIVRDGAAGCYDFRVERRVEDGQ